MDISQLDPQALLQQLDEEMQLLVLVTGELQDGSSHYAYVSIRPSRYAAFKEAEQKGNYDLGEYGTILTHGAGAPSEDVKMEMEEKYGADHMFESQLESLLQGATSTKK